MMISSNDDDATLFSIAVYERASQDEGYRFTKMVKVGTPGVLAGFSIRSSPTVESGRKRGYWPA